MKKIFIQFVVGFIFLSFSHILLCQSRMDSLMTLGGTIWGEDDSNCNLENETGGYNIIVELYNNQGILLQSTYTNTNSEFKFDSLQEGDYKIIIPKLMFGSSAPLYGLTSCGCTGGDDDVDNDDNGNFNSNGDVETVKINLTYGFEPDSNGTENYTIDFCFESDCNLINPITYIACDSVKDTICDLRNLDLFCGRMYAPPLVGNSPNPVCNNGGQPHNMTWIAFEAGLGNYSIDINIFGCSGGQNGAQLGVYEVEDCDFENAVEIFCIGSPCVTGLYSIPNHDLVPGNTYHLWLDGCAGSVCSYDINITGDYQPFEFNQDSIELICEFCDDPQYGGSLYIKTNGPEYINHKWKITYPNGDTSIVITDNNYLELFLDFVGDYKIDLLNIVSACNQSELNNLSYSFTSRDPLADLLEIFIFADVNQNLIYDNNDYPVNNAVVHFNSLNLNVLSNQNGIAYGNVNTGNYSFNVFVPYGKWKPEPYSTSVQIETQKVRVNIPLLPEQSFNKGKLVTHVPILRCNTKNSINTSFTNLSSNVFTGRLECIVDSKALFSDYEPVFGINEDTLFVWEVDSLFPGEKFRIDYKLFIPVELLGDSIHYKYYFIDNNGDTLDIYTFSHLVRCSYDPNDKLTYPDRIGKENYTLFSEDIVYTIRFQNTGNDTAYSVKIIDEDYIYNFHYDSTIILESSHDVKTLITDDPGLLFVFDNIFLPDSATNFEASQGYVTFSGKYYKPQEEGAKIYNQAGIFFDFNPPIKTNFVVNTLVTSLPCPDDSIYQIDNYLSAVKDANLYKWYNCSNDELLFTSTETTFYPEKSGNYYVIVIGDHCTKKSECFSFIHTSIKNNFNNMKIYPSPVHDKLIITSDLDFDIVEILNIDSKILMSKFFLSTSNRKVEVDMSDLSNGLYFIKIKTKSGLEYIEKVIKE